MRGGQETSATGVVTSGPASAPTSRRARLVGPLATLVAFASVLAASELSWRTTAPLPFWDEWVDLTAAEHLSNLFVQHNEHRLAFPRLVFAADAAFSASSNRLEVGVAIGMLLLAATFTAAAASDRLPRVSRPAAHAFGICVLLSLRGWEVLTWGYAVQLPCVLAAAVVAFVAAADRRAHPTTVALAIAASGAAAYSMGNGLLVGWIAVVLAILVRRPRAQVVSILLASVVIDVAYLADFVSPPADRPALVVLIEHPLRAVRFFLAFLGSSFARSLDLAAVFGAVGLGLASHTAVGTIRRPPTTSGAWVLRAILAFTLLSAALTTVGRGVGATSVASRYVPVSGLFWVALLLERIGTSSGRSRVFHLVLAAALVVVTVAAIPSSRARASRRSDRLRIAEAAILAGVPEHDAISAAYDDLAVARRGISVLRQHALSVFAEPWSAWSGRRLDELVRIEGGPCAARLDRLERVDGIDGSHGVRVVGHGVSPLGRRLVLTDGRGVVVGYGFILGRGDLVAFAAPPADATAIRGFLLTDDAVRACPIAGVLALPTAP